MLTWRVSVHDGRPVYGPDGYGWQIRRLRRAERKARRELDRYLRRKERAAKRVIIRVDGHGCPAHCEAATERERSVARARKAEETARLRLRWAWLPWSGTSRERAQHEYDVARTASPQRMARVTITIEADDAQETHIEITEDSRIITSSRGDLALVPDTLGMAIRRAVAAVAPTAKDREEAIRTVASYITAAK